ncbi:hypothetical protein ScPMuIL_005715 [Solemya velum]
MEVYGNDSESFKLFLGNICRDIDEPEADNSQTRPRNHDVYNPRIAQHEIEGECLDWSMHYLASRNCPDILATAISRATCDAVGILELSAFYVEEEKQGDSEENKSQEKYIDGKKLLTEVIENIHLVCKLWRENMPELPIPSTKFSVSSHAIKNTRRKMEDCHVICQDLNTLFGLKGTDRQSYFAVFDGHGGLEAALYAGCHLHYNIVHSNCFQTDPVKAMKSAYKLTDLNFIDRAKRDRLRAGTTAVTALVRESKLYIGWVGDSQAVLVRDGRTVQIMEPHKPEREDEKARIESLGGCVVFFGTWRVNGNIAVSRAIGDAWDKPYICSDADVAEIDLDGTEDYLVLGCDGLWDGLSADSLPEINSIGTENHSSQNEKNISEKGTKDPKPTDHEIHRDDHMLVQRPMSNKQCNELPENDLTTHKDTSIENSQTLENRKLTKKKKRFRRIYQQEERRTRKRSGLKSPIVWSFAGKNRVSVQNHKLNSLSRSTGLSGTSWALDNPRPGQLESIVDRVSQTNLYNMVSDSDLMMSHPAFNLNSSQPFKLEPLTTSVNPLPSVTSYGAKKPVISSTIDKFRTSWRPRRLNKICSGAFYESPPSPFMNTGIERTK